VDSKKKPWEFDNPICAQIGIEPFYLDEDTLPKTTDDYSRGKKLCSSCDHQYDCADWGIYHERYGLWGGLTPEERALIRRRKNIVIPLEVL
jgi:hypothetical protein